MDPRYSAPKSLSRRVGAKYLKTKVQVADRMELLLITYDELVKAAEGKNEAKVKKISDLLINSLDFDHATEFGIGMLRLYKYCIQEAEQGNFDEVIRIVSQLREAWRILQKSQLKEGKDNG